MACIVAHERPPKGGHYVRPSYFGGWVGAGFFALFFLTGFFFAVFLGRGFLGAGWVVGCPFGGGVGAGVCARAREPLNISTPSAAAAVLRNFDIIERLYGPRLSRTTKESINDASG